MKKIFLVLLVSMVLIGALPLFAGGTKEGGTGAAAGTQKPADTMLPQPKEAPALNDMVKAGKLPSVDKRLPKDVLVVTPTEAVGKYGGTWRVSYRSISAWALWGYILKENEILYTTDFKTLIPSLLKSFQTSPDNKVFTFVLRQGVKWSDGEVYDADDYEFWWNDILLNNDLTPSKPGEFLAGGKLPKFEKIDQYTVRFTFDAPYATFLHRLAQQRYTSSRSGPLARPAHYLKQFHIKYASKDAIDKATKDGGYATWMDMFNAKADNVLNPALPTLCAWRNLDLSTGAVMRFERNPYYWKVDTAGNQLPYIDKLEMSFYPDIETCLLKALAGECDFQYREISSLANYPTLMKGADKGGYRIVESGSLASNMYAIFFNRLTSDPVKNKLYNDFRFRQALSIAIDRDQINNVLLNGMSAVMQVSPPVGVASYDETVAKMYTKLDVAGANKLLDDIGMKWDSKHEWRLDPDGKPISFNKIFYGGPFPPFQAEAQDLIKENWKQIGINLNNRFLERALWTSAMAGKDWDLSAYAVDTGGGAYLLGNGMIFPQNINWYTGPQWGLWYSSLGKGGVEPPAEVKQLRALYDEYGTTATQERMIGIEKEAAKLYVTNLLSIGIMSRPRLDTYYVVNKRMKNVPAKLQDDVGIFTPAQFYFE